jgi:hypothetical protein
VKCCARVEVFGRILLGVLVVLFGAAHLWELSAPPRIPETHSTFVLRNERMVGASQGISIDDPKEESEYLLRGIGRWNGVSVISPESEAGPICCLTRRQERRLAEQEDFRPDQQAPFHSHKKRLQLACFRDFPP